MTQADAMRTEGRDLDAAREELRRASFLERCACVARLTDGDMLALAVGGTPDRKFAENLLRGLHPDRLARLQLALDSTRTLGSADHAAAADHVRAALVEVGRDLATPEQEQAMDTVVGLLLALAPPALCEVVEAGPWGLLGALVSRHGGVQGQLAAHLRQCDDWGFVEDWVGLTQTGRLPRTDVDEWLAQADGTVPGFSWTRAVPAMPSAIEPEPKGWAGTKVNGLDLLPFGVPAEHCDFADIARLDRQGLQALLRDEPLELVVRALPRDPADATGRALLSCMSPNLRESVLAEVLVAQPTWVQRARAQSELAKHLCSLVVQGTIPPVQDGKAANNSELALLLVETRTLRRIVCDMPPRQLRRLLGELDSLTIEAVTAAAPMDIHFLDHLCSALAEQVGQQLRAFALAPERHLVRAGQLREAVDGIYVELSRLAATHAEDAQLAELASLAHRLIQALEADETWFTTACRLFPQELHATLVQRSGGLGGSWAHRLRAIWGERKFAFFAEVCAADGSEPMDKADAVVWLTLLREVGCRLS